MSRRWLAAALGAALVVGAAGCASDPSGPCLPQGPASVTVPFGRMEVMSWEADGQTELVRFQFDPSIPGSTTATVEPADDGPWHDRVFDEPVRPAGAVQTSIRLEGLASVGQVDQLAAGDGDDMAIRAIVPIADPTALRVIVGTVDGRCLRLRADPETARITLLVNAE